VFAGRAAAEIVAGDQDLAVPRRRVVERETGTLRAVLVVAEVVEQCVTEAFPGRRREKARRYDLVRVDVPGRQNDGS